MPLFFLTTGCNNGDNQSASEDQDTSESPGALSLSLIDANDGSYQAVYVTVDTVSVHKEDDAEESWTEVATPRKTVNLLELVGGVREELGLANLATGHYTQLRLLIGEAADNGINILSQSHPFANYVIDTENTVHELKVPSGEESGEKIVQGFDISTNETTELILDFDASESVVIAGNSGQYLLKPTIQVLLEEEAAIVSGTITDTVLFEPLGSVAVSAQLYSPSAADPKDQVAVQAATQSDTTGAYSLFVSPGTYTLVGYKTGYLPAVHSISLSTGATLTQNIALAPAELGQLSGTVSLSGASSDTFATIRIQQTVAIDASPVVIEVTGLNVKNGEAFQLSLPEGDYTVVSESAGYSTQTTVITVINSSTVALEISLSLSS